jgi:hypothetical protein
MSNLQKVMERSRFRDTRRCLEDVEAHIPDGPSPSGNKVGKTRAHPWATRGKLWRDQCFVIPGGVSNTEEPMFRNVGTRDPGVRESTFWRRMKTHVLDTWEPTTHDQGVGLCHFQGKPTQLFTINTNRHLGML